MNEPENVYAAPTQDAASSLTDPNQAPGLLRLPYFLWSLGVYFVALFFIVVAAIIIFPLAIFPFGGMMMVFIFSLFALEKYRVESFVDLWSADSHR